MVFSFWREGRHSRRAAARQDQIEQRNDEREQRERPERAVGAEEPELHVRGAESDQDAEKDPPGARIRSRLRVRDHEEREEEQRAALEPVERNRERIVGGERPREQK